MLMGSVGAQQTMKMEPLPFRAPLTEDFRVLRLTPTSEVRPRVGGGAQTNTNSQPIALINKLEFRTAVSNVFWGVAGT